MQTLNKNKIIKLLKRDIKECKEKERKLKKCNVDDYKPKIDEILGCTDTLNYILCEILSKKYDN
jgi:hypothetical protein